MAARRQALREAAQLQLRYGLDEPQHLFAHWSRGLFGQLLEANALHSFDLATALDEPPPTEGHPHSYLTLPEINVCGLLHQHFPAAPAPA